MVSVLPETHPFMFTNDNILSTYDTTGLYGIKDPSEVNLINTYNGSDNQFLRISVNRCQGNNCADEDVINSFLTSHSGTLFQAQSYIDYDDVEAKEG